MVDETGALIDDWTFRVGGAGETIEMEAVPGLLAETDFVPTIEDADIESHLSGISAGSLNEYMVGDRHISIPGTLLISAMSVMDDWKKTQNANLKKKDNLLYIVGETKAELGASEYFRMQKNESGALPRVNKETAKKTLEAVSAAINKGLVSACHDMSEGGLAVAISEMCIGSDMGANIFLPEVPISSGMLDYELLFSESPTRFMVEVDKDKKEQFQTALEGISLGLIGCVSDEKKLVVYGKDKECINIEIEQLRDSWMKTFEEFRK